MRNSCNIRILSIFLSLLMILGALSSFTILPAFAAEEGTDTEPTTQEGTVTDPTTDEETPTTDEVPETGDAPTTGEDAPSSEFITVEEAILTYLTKEYTTKEEKLATMTLKLTRGDLQLYVDARTGEVAVRNIKTGQIVTSNPYDVATINDTSEIKLSTIKNELLSQVFISFEDIANGNINREMNSFADCAQYGQINVKNIKNGLRVEYTLGKLATKKLLPLWIEASRFESMILMKIEDEYIQKQFASFYSYININGELVESLVTSHKENYPCVGKTYKAHGYTPLVTETTFLSSTNEVTTHTYSVDDYMSIYVIDSKAIQSERESNMLEGYTKAYAPEYNYEEQDFDVQLTGYVATDSAAAIFNMALEYSLTDRGLTVRLPANGISFDEESYSLKTISILRYMGATSNDYTGYTFLPDGSGTIIRNEDMVEYGLTYTLSGDVYGPDFSYHTLSYNGKSEIFRLPVFGTVEDTTYFTDKVIGKEVVYDLDDAGNIKMDQAGNKIPLYVAYDGGRDITVIKDENGKSIYYFTDTLDVIEVPVETPEETPDATTDVPSTNLPSTDVPTTGETADDSTATVAEEEEPTTNVPSTNLPGTDVPATEEPTTPPTTKIEYIVTEKSEMANVIGIADAVTGTTTYYILDEYGNRVKQYRDIYESYTVSQGIVAIVNGGESLTTLTSAHGGNQTHKYNSVYPTFKPLSTDTYNLRDAISVGDDATWTVTSERKYTGAFEVSYIMISDFEGSTYEGSYTGMAKAYQDHLVETQGMSLLSDTAADIPLYIESFGMLQTQDTFLTFPVWVDTPLTTMDDIQTMRDELANPGEGGYAITNLHFRLKGFNEGGMDTSYAPTLVKFEKVLGGNKGYAALVEDAKKDGYAVYPEFDFANVENDKLFDGFAYSDQTIRTIDDRYTSKREYDATYQTFQRVHSVAVSPWAYSEMVEKFIAEFADLPVSGISVSTLGTDLNSDFDQDDPYNREDNKEYSIEAIKALSEKFGNLMIDGGNAYALGYVSHILNMPLDGSRYMRASQAIPFMGMVLHGYVQYAGTPTNMEGDTAYEILKIIENGAAPYFILSYQNTEEMKEMAYLADYYSVNFQIWKEDMTKIYQILNEALKDVQTKTITTHEFVDGSRVLSRDEQVELMIEQMAAETAYRKAKNSALLTAVKNAVAGGLITLPEDYRYTDEKGNVIVPEGFDLDTFEAEYETFEEYYKPGLDPVIDDHTIVYEVYGNEVGFILNYNNFAVEVEINGTTYTVEALDFVKIPKV